MSCSYSPLPVALSRIDSPFFLLQVPVVDCLDSANSSIRINSVSGRVSTVKEYTFSNSADLSMGLFKIPETLGLETLATEAFTKVVQEAGLKGLNFKPLKIRS